jgi:hypothetical protein
MPEMQEALQGRGNWRMGIFEQSNSFFESAGCFRPDSG